MLQVKNIWKLVGSKYSHGSYVIVAHKSYKVFCIVYY